MAKLSIFINNLALDNVTCSPAGRETFCIYTRTDSIARGVALLI